ncbi:MAG: BamA/TamA family outer membrane protein [Burkholderiales bacterium]
MLRVVAILAMSCSCAFAQTEQAAGAKSRPAGADQEESPWLLAPVFSSNPKLGTSLGALAGYLHYFDQKSRPSIFAATGQYTSTESIVAGAFAKTSFDEDHQRLIAALVYGNIKNDYDDYLGTGVPLRNDATLKSFIVRYTYRVKGDWFIGAQGIYQNFAIAGDTAFDDQVLDVLGVKPFKSAGAGLVVQNDSRDSENMPTRGWLLNLNNIAFRESLGGDNDYDVYRAEVRYFIPHGNRNVFAIRQLNHLTSDAPAAARAPVQLRGYKVGQYTGEYMSAIEAEERYRFAEKWTATVFVGVACLYGDGKKCSDGANLYAAAGAGAQYILKPKEGIVLNLEYAAGEDGNYGFYLKLGYGF